MSSDNIVLQQPKEMSGGLATGHVGYIHKTDLEIKLDHLHLEIIELNKIIKKMQSDINILKNNYSI